MDYRSAKYRASAYDKANGRWWALVWYNVQGEPTEKSARQMLRRHNESFKPGGVNDFVVTYKYGCTVRPVFTKLLVISQKTNRPIIRVSD